jgi:histidinol phosphatase-like PHP family hydrolase
MSVVVYNLHNHTRFSDGAYSADEICEAHAELEGLRVDGVGISDHLFCTPSSREVSGEKDFERLFAAETRRYVEHVHAVRRRWSGRLRVFCGCEIHWPLNRHMLPVIQRMLGGVDYVLFEYLDWAALTQLAHQARRWACPVGLAHTCVAESFPHTSMDQVVRTLANARIFYEINSRFLPLAEEDRWFNLLSRHRVAVSLGTDTHDDLACLAKLKELHAYALRRGLGGHFLLPVPVSELVTADRSA